MNLLQYTSKEMFSSTELIRKSKMVFDKLSDEEIEKAVILRDGKPSFILLDFDKYESIIEEYDNLIKENKKLKEKKKNETTSKDINKKEDEISSDELEEALAQIEQLDISLNKKDESIKKQEALKDFWE